MSYKPKSNINNNSKPKPFTMNYNFQVAQVYSVNSRSVGAKKGRNFKILPRKVEHLSTDTLSPR